MKSLVILATGIGLGGSAAATYRAHRKPMSPEWDEPVGDTRFRRSDLPIGGAVALTLAFGSLVTGHRKAAAVLAGAGLGATAGSLGVAVLNPLADTEPAVDDSASQAPWPPASQTNGAKPGGASAGEAAGADVLTPGVVASDLSGAASSTLADADDALGGLSTDTADGLAAEARAKASLHQPQQDSDPSPAPDTAAGDPPAPVSDPAQPPSATSDLDDDARAEQQLEQAEEAVEHQASYGSPSLDDMTPESSDEPPSESEVTGSAPQQGQSSVPDAWKSDEDA